MTYDTVVSEERLNCRMTGLGPQQSRVHTFCRKTSEYTIDKERIIVGIGLRYSEQAEEHSLKALKLLFPVLL